MAEYNTLSYEQDGHVTVLTYDRPEQRNAVSREMNAELHHAWQRFRDDPDAFVLVITGRGDAFCAGWDLADAAQTELGDWDEFKTHAYNSPGDCGYTRRVDVFKPVIAAVNGYCLGYGLTLVTWCDFVIASDRAEFGYPEVRLGVPAAVGALRLPERIGWQFAMELLLTGDRIDAARAHEIGLAGWVVPHAELMVEARRLALRLTDAAPLAQRAMKEIATRSRRLPPLESVRFAETMRKVVASTADAAEGAQAAAERRPPRWQGR
jgi:E-phenylitaconyl-CoA hydratase